MEVQDYRNSTEVEGLMAVSIEQMLQIEDPRNHSVDVQDRLRHLLAIGAPARPDQKRPDFFEIEDDDQVFYIHVSKNTGTVTLLAVWDKDPESVATERVA